MGFWQAALPGDLRTRISCFDIELQGLIVDAKAYVYYTDSVAAADYLSAILNSELLDALVKPMQSMGLFGPRDIHKRPLEAAIPRYDPGDMTHQDLASLSRACSEKLGRALPEILSSTTRKSAWLSANALGRARKQITSTVAGEFREIDRLVEGILFLARFGHGVARLLEPVLRASRS